MITLIMCQGQSSRWAGSYPKHLAMIAGEPVIVRTMRQLKALNIDNVIIVGEEYHFGQFGKVHEQIDPQPEICNGIRDTYPLWEGHDRTVILCGDVVYSDACIRAIYEDQTQLRIFGRIGENPITGKAYDERFAVAFDEDYGLPVLWAIDAVLLRPECIASLKALYYIMLGVPCVPQGDKVFFERKLLHIIDDYTDDLDSLEEWERSREKLEAAILQERSGLSHINPLKPTYHYPDKNWRL